MKLELALSDEDVEDLMHMIHARARVIACGLDTGKPGDHALGLIEEAIIKAKGEESAS